MFLLTRILALKQSNAGKNPGRKWNYLLIVMKGGRKEKEGRKGGNNDDSLFWITPWLLIQMLCWIFGGGAFEVIPKILLLWKRGFSETWCDENSLLSGCSDGVWGSWKLYQIINARLEVTGEALSFIVS